MTTDEFAYQIKGQYPQYQNVDNKALTTAILQKYPQYQSHVQDSGTGNSLSNSFGEATGLKGTVNAIGDTLTQPIVGSTVNNNVQKTSDIIAKAKSLPKGAERTALLKQSADLANKNQAYAATNYAAMPTQKEAAGSIAKLGLNALLFGSGGIAADVGGYAGTAARAAEFGGLGAGLHAAENAETNKPITEGLGSSFVTNALIPPAIEGGLGLAAKTTALASEQAPRIINSLIKPLLKDFSYGKDPGKAIAELGIIANSPEELLQKVTQTKNVVGRSLSWLGDRLSALSPGGKLSLDISSALTPIEDAMQKAAKTNDYSLLHRLESVKRGLMEDLGLKNTEQGAEIVSNGLKDLKNLDFHDVVQFKRDIGDLTKWTGLRTEDEAVNAALKKSYGIAKETMNTAAHELSPELGAAMEKMNETYANLTSAEVATKYRDILDKRQSLIGLKAGLGGLGGAIISAVASGGATIPTLIGSAIATGGTALIDSLASSTAFKTRLANALEKLSPEEIAQVSERLPFIKRLIGSGEKDKESASSVMSYITKSGRKVFTRLTPEEFAYFKDEVGTIPKAAEGYSQIHLDADTENLKKSGKELPRDTFMKGHPQLKDIFEKFKLH